MLSQYTESVRRTTIERDVRAVAESNVGREASSSNSSTAQHPSQSSDATAKARLVKELADFDLQRALPCAPPHPAAAVTKVPKMPLLASCERHVTNTVKHRLTIDVPPQVAPVVNVDDASGDEQAKDDSKALSEDALALTLLDFYTQRVHDLATQLEMLQERWARYCNDGDMAKRLGDAYHERCAMLVDEAEDAMARRDRLFHVAQCQAARLTGDDRQVLHERLSQWIVHEGNDVTRLVECASDASSSSSSSSSARVLPDDIALYVRHIIYCNATERHIRNFFRLFDTAALTHGISLAPRESSDAVYGTEEDSLGALGGMSSRNGNSHFAAYGYASSSISGVSSLHSRASWNPSSRASHQYGNSSTRKGAASKLGAGSRMKSTSPLVHKNLGDAPAKMDPVLCNLQSDVAAMLVGFGIEVEPLDERQSQLPMHTEFGHYASQLLDDHCKSSMPDSIVGVTVPSAQWMATVTVRARQSAAVLAQTDALARFSSSAIDETLRLHASLLDLTDADAVRLRLRDATESFLANILDGEQQQREQEKKRRHGRKSAGNATGTAEAQSDDSDDDDPIRASHQALLSHLAAGAGSSVVARKLSSGVSNAAPSSGGTHTPRAQLMLARAHLRYIETRAHQQLCRDTLNYFESVRRTVAATSTPLFTADRRPAEESQSRRADFHRWDTTAKRLLVLDGSTGESIVHQSALDEYRRLTHELLSVASWYLHERCTREPKTVHDRAEVLHRLWRSESEFLTAKRRLVDVYLSAHEHISQGPQRVELTQCIVNALDRRPRLDLASDDFVPSYESETRALALHRELASLLYTRLVAESRAFLVRTHASPSSTFSLTTTGDAEQSVRSADLTELSYTPTAEQVRNSVGMGCPPAIVRVCRITQRPHAEHLDRPDHLDHIVDEHTALPLPEPFLLEFSATLGLLAQLDTQLQLCFDRFLTWEHVQTAAAAAAAVSAATTSAEAQVAHPHSIRTVVDELRLELNVLQRLLDMWSAHSMADTTQLPTATTALALTQFDTTATTSVSQARELLSTVCVDDPVVALAAVTPAHDVASLVRLVDALVQRELLAGAMFESSLLASLYQLQASATLCCDDAVPLALYAETLDTSKGYDHDDDDAGSVSTSAATQSSLSFTPTSAAASSFTSLSACAALALNELDPFVACAFRFDDPHEFREHTLSTNGIACVRAAARVQVAQARLLASVTRENCILWVRMLSSNVSDARRLFVSAVHPKQRARERSLRLHLTDFRRTNSGVGSSVSLVLATRLTYVHSYARQVQACATSEASRVQIEINSVQMRRLLARATNGTSACSRVFVLNQRLDETHKVVRAHDPSPDEANDARATAPFFDLSLMSRDGTRLGNPWFVVQPGDACLMLRSPSAVPHEHSALRAAFVATTAVHDLTLSALLNAVLGEGSLRQRRVWHADVEYAHATDDVTESCFATLQRARDQFATVAGDASLTLEQLLETLNDMRCAALMRDQLVFAHLVPHTFATFFGPSSRSGRGHSTYSYRATGTATKPSLKETPASTSSTDSGTVSPSKGASSSSSSDHYSNIRGWQRSQGEHINVHWRQQFPREYSRRSATAAIDGSITSVPFANVVAIQRDVRASIVGLTDIERNYVHGEVLGVRLMLEEVLIDEAIDEYATPREAARVQVAFLRDALSLERAKEQWAEAVLKQRDVYATETHASFVAAYNTLLTSTVAPNVAPTTHASAVHVSREWTARQQQVALVHNQLVVAAYGALRRFVAQAMHTLVRERALMATNLELAAESTSGSFEHYPTTTDGDSVDRTHTELVQTFLLRLFAGAQEEQEGKKQLKCSTTGAATGSSGATVTFARDHVNDCVLDLGAAVARLNETHRREQEGVWRERVTHLERLVEARERNVTQLRAVLEEERIQRTHLMRSEGLARARELMREIAVLRHRTEERERLWETERAQVRRAVRLEYEQLVRSMAAVTVTYKSRLAEFRTSLYHDVVEALSETREEVLQEIVTLAMVEEDGGVPEAKRALQRKIAERHGEISTQELLTKEAMELTASLWSLMVKKKVMNEFKSMAMTTRYSKRTTSAVDDLTGCQRDLWEEETRGRSERVAQQDQTASLAWRIRELEDQVGKLERSLEGEQRERLALMAWKETHVKERERLEERLATYSAIEHYDVDELLAELNEKRGAVVELTEATSRAEHEARLLRHEKQQSVRTLERQLRRESSLKQRAFETIDVLHEQQQEVQQVETDGYSMVGARRASRGSTLVDFDELHSSEERAAQARLKYVKQQLAAATSRGTLVNQSAQRVLASTQPRSVVVRRGSGMDNPLPDLPASPSAVTADSHSTSVASPPPSSSLPPIHLK